MKGSAYFAPINPVLHKNTNKNGIAWIDGDVNAGLKLGIGGMGGSGGGPNPAPATLR